MKPIHMVDLKGQFDLIKDEIYSGFEQIFTNSSYIKGADVGEFAKEMASYTGAKHVIPCANGTDAIQIALMALDLKPGDEVMVPTWTYVATVEVIALLGLTPIFVDAFDDTFNINITGLESKISPNTKAIVPVHLYGQCCDMEAILTFAKKHQLYVIEDTAQAIGAVYTFSNGEKKQAGTMGDIGTTSFFPSKNLGCYGDGGAIFTDNDQLAKQMHAICDHGQLHQKYYHDIIGINSRLDSLQAVVLRAKLKRLKNYEEARNNVAAYYDRAFEGIAAIQTPYRSPMSTHVFHQYTIKIKNGRRNALKQYLEEQKIPAMIYYPLPLYQQKAYASFQKEGDHFPVSDRLALEVISLPIHTEMQEDQLSYIVSKITSFFKS